MSRVSEQKQGWFSRLVLGPIEVQDELRGGEPADWTPGELAEIRAQVAEEAERPKPEPCPTCGRRPGPLSLFTPREEGTNA